MAANETTIDLTIEKNWRRDWTAAITHRAARALGLALTAHEFSVPMQDCADPSRTFVVLEDSNGVARATYYLRVDSDHEELLIRKIDLMTAEEAQADIDQYC
jgi:hypothetical protein